MAFINEDGEHACGQSVHMGQWTVKITFELYALNSVGGPSEGRSQVFFQEGSWQMPNL